MRRIAITMILVTSMSGLAAASPDPFATPNPVPSSAEPSERDHKLTVPALLPTCDVVDRGTTKKRAALAFAAGGAALWLGSFVLSLHERSEYDHAATYVDANHARDIARYYGTGLFAAGAVAFGVSAYLYFTVPAKEAATRTSVVPTASADQLGLAVVGGF